MRSCKGIRGVSLVLSVAQSKVRDFKMVMAGVSKSSRCSLSDLFSSPEMVCVHLDVHSS